MAQYGNVLYVIGGHSMVWDKGDEKDKVHDDIWALHLDTLQVRQYSLA